MEDDNEGLELWQKNLLVLIDSYPGKDKRSDIARRAGVSPSLITKYTNPGCENPILPILSRICKVFGCSIYTLFSDKSPATPSPPVKAKVIGEIYPSDLKVLIEWVMEQPEPKRMAANIRYMVETRYGEFEEWQKKREQLGNCGTSPESKSAI